MDERGHIVKSKNRIRLVPASEAKNNFGEMIKRVYENEETQVIERAGLPVAAVVTISDLERLYPEKVKELPKAEVSAKRQRAWESLMAVLNRNPGAAEDMTDEEVMAEALRAIQEVRRVRRKK